MESSLTITLDRVSMEALLARAGRAEPRDSFERDALHDAHMQVIHADDDAARAAADTDPQQLSLFDASVYDA